MAKRSTPAKKQPPVAELRARRSALAECIEEIRKQKKLSRQAVADRLKTKRLQVWRIENGVTDLGADDVPAWAEALGVTVAAIYRKAA